MTNWPSLWKLLKSTGFGLLSIKQHHSHSSSDPLTLPSVLKTRYRGGFSQEVLLSQLWALFWVPIANSFHKVFTTVQMQLFFVHEQLTLLLILPEFTTDTYNASSLRRLLLDSGHQRSSPQARIQDGFGILVIILRPQDNFSSYVTRF